MAPDDVITAIDRVPARPALTDARPEPIVGYVDRIDGHRITGWAWNRARPDLALDIEIRLDDRVVASLRADRFRKDLAQSKIGDGSHAFEATLEQAIPPDGHARVAVLARAAESGTVVRLINRALESGKTDEAAPPPQLRRWLEDLAGVQRSFEDALKTAARDMRDAVRSRPTASGDTADVGRLVEELRGSQEALARQIEALEVFQARFDKVLSAAERPTTDVDSAGAADRGLKLAVTAAAGVSTISLLIGLWAVLH